MKREISLSINPSYFCNFRCSFCYLSHKQLSNPQKIDLRQLNSLINDIKISYEIKHIDLYGGEIGLLPESYLNELISLIGLHYGAKINLVTNLSQIQPIFYHPMIDISVSWDAHLRQDSAKVYENIIQINKDVHILMLASAAMTQWNDSFLDETILKLNKVKNIKSVELKPYSRNQANSHEWSNRHFVSFVERWLYRKNNFRFTFTNEKNIIECLGKTKNSWSDDHLYITPSGNIAVLDFDQQMREKFVELRDLEEYETWCREEKSKINSNPDCKKCNHLGHCLSEHLKNHNDPTDVCDGFKPLLDNYLNQKYN